jgi:DNA (cytosine-5)-methyltransferase 1
MNKKYLSFFSGALGLDLGLEKKGWECLSVNEFDKKICETIKANKPNIKLYDCDIRSLTSEKISKDLNIKKGELFAIVGGPPCQSFSTAGKRLGLADDRGNVFLHFLDIVGELSPNYVIIENVRGLLSAPLEHIPHNLRDDEFKLKNKNKAGGVIKLVIKKLESFGYKVSFNLYDTSLYGVPQKRERVVIIASKKDMVPYLKPTHGLGKKKIKTVKDAIKNIKAKNYINFPKKRLKFIKKLKSGQNWKDLSLKDQKAAMGKSFYLGGGKTGFLRRLDWEKPAPTLVTSPIMPATTLAHPEENRPLSVEEYSAIQTFPPNYKFSGSTLYQYKQIGNAIPCVFGEVIAQHIEDFEKGLTKEHNEPTSRYKNCSDKDFLK